MRTTKIISIGAGKDYANLNAFRSWLNNQDLIAQDVYIEAHVYDNQSMKSSAAYIGPKKSDLTRYCLIRPAPGLGVFDLYPDAPVDWKPNGILLSFIAETYYALRISSGVVLEGFRITTSANTGSTTAPLSCYQSVALPMGSYQCGLRRNLILADTSSAPALAITSGVSGGTSALIADNVFITETSAPRATMLTLGQPCVVERNTFVRRNDKTLGHVWISITYTTHCPTFRNNLLIGESAESIRFTLSATVATAARNASIGNFADSSVAIAGYLPSMVTTASGLTVSLFDLTPSESGALIGSADTSARTTPDLFGHNRGLLPDVGAVQRTPAIPAPAGEILTLSADGQTITVTGSTQNQIDTVSAMLIAANPANGAADQGPMTASLGKDEFVASFSKVPIGSYAEVRITLSNPGGIITLNSLSALQIIGLDGMPQATVTNEVNA